MTSYEKVASITTAATAPTTEAFATLNIVKTASTGTTIGGTTFENGGQIQFRNDSTARAYTAKLYYSLVDSPGVITVGDWLEYDSVSVAAQVGAVLGNAFISWSRPYRWLAISISAASATTGAVLIDMYAHK